MEEKSRKIKFKENSIKMVEDVIKSRHSGLSQRAKSLVKIGSLGKQSKFDDINSEFTEQEKRKRIRESTS